MANLRSFKINNIDNSSQRTLNLKRITLYNNTKNIIADFSNSNCGIKTSNRNVNYSAPVNVNGQCVSSAKNYELLLDVTKGKYLNSYACQTDLSYSIIGNINDANLLYIKAENDTINSSRDVSSINDSINISNQNVSSDIIYKNPGVYIVPDYSYNCDESFFNIRNIQTNIDLSFNDFDESTKNYYNKMAQQDKLYGFRYPMKFKI
jgi:hypothetical protein